MYSATLLGFTEPPYCTRTLSATAWPKSAATVSRTTLHIFCASSWLADLPVPIAQIGSYAITSEETCSSDKPARAAETCPPTNSAALPAS